MENYYLSFVTLWTYLVWIVFSGAEVITYFSCATQMSMKFSMLINIKIPTIPDIFIFISKEFSCSALFGKKVFAVVSNDRFISRANFMLSWVEHEKKSNITSGQKSDAWLEGWGVGWKLSSGIAAAAYGIDLDFQGTLIVAKHLH